MRVAFLILTLLLAGKDSSLTNSASQVESNIWRGGNIKPYIYNQGSVTSGEIISKDHISKYKEWDINVLRVQMFLDKSSSFFASSRKKQKKKHNSDGSKTGETLLETYGNYLIGLDSTAKYCAEFDIDFYISLHGVKNRYEEPDSLLKNLTEFWSYIANKYKSNKNFIGYDLLNEPNTAYETRQLYKRGGVFDSLIANIRKIDTTRYIIAEVIKEGSADGFKEIQPLNDKKVIYSFHFYEPHQYAYQGIGGHKEVGINYPGNLRPDHEQEKIYYDKEALKRDLRPVRKFQKEHNVQIMVGEFSAVRWAPNAEKYLQDLMEIFEEYEWHWTYQTLYGEWNGWCLTMPNEAEQQYGYEFQTTQTERFKTVSNFWKLNAD